MKTLKNKLYIGLTTIALGMAGAVYAQSAPPPAPSGDHAAHSQSPADSVKWAAKMKERIAKHQAEMHDKLKITAAQEPAWKTFTDAIAPGAMPARINDKDMEKLTTPERLEKGMERAKEHLAQMQTRLNALKTFYAVLSPEQKKVFDESHKQMEKSMHERMSGHMGEHMRGQGADHHRGDGGPNADGKKPM